jgi:hypothetical protein
MPRLKKIYLKAMSDEYDREPGLIIKGQPQFDGLSAAREGVLLAHDILEHQNGVKEIGQVWDELEALGALYQVRGRHGDLLTKSGSHHSVEVNLASDVTRMFADYCASGYDGPGSHREGTRACDYDETFKEVIEIARRDIPREHTDMGRGLPDEDENGWDADMREAFPHYLALALRRMRIGYRKAVKKYGHGYQAYELFRLIRDAADKIKPEFEGQEFVLCYNSERAFIEEIYEGED